MSEQWLKFITRGEDGSISAGSYALNFPINIDLPTLELIGRHFEIVIKDALIEIGYLIAKIISSALPLMLINRIRIPM